MPARRAGRAERLVSRVFALSCGGGWFGRSLRFRAARAHPGSVDDALARCADSTQAAVRGWVTPQEAAAVLQVSPRIVRNMLRRGVLDDARPGRLRGVDARQLAVLIGHHPLAVSVLDAIISSRFVVQRVPLDEALASLIESRDAVR
jgi:excisionase family DNA binding protein